MKTILACIDFSAASTLVLAEATALARALHTRLVVLHVVQPPIVTMSDVGTELSTKYAAEESAAVSKQLAALRKQLRPRATTVEVKAIVGVPGQCILTEARSINADYIVLGSHGHGALYDLIVGSTASRVLKQAGCPVVVVPQAKKADESPSRSPGDLRRVAPLAERPKPRRQAK